jgi:hypothetical protein
MSHAISHYGTAGLRFGRAVRPKLIACTVVAVITGTVAYPIGVLIAQSFLPPPADLVSVAAPTYINHAPVLSEEMNTPSNETAVSPPVEMPPPPSVAQVTGDATALSNAAPSAAIMSTTRGGIPSMAIEQQSRPRKTGILATPHDSVLALLRAMARSKPELIHPRHANRDHPTSKTRSEPTLTGEGLTNQPDETAPVGHGTSGATALGGPATVHMGLNGTGMRHRL